MRGTAEEKFSGREGEEGETKEQMGQKKCRRGGNRGGDHGTAEKEIQG